MNAPGPSSTPPGPVSLPQAASWPGCSMAEIMPHDRGKALAELERIAQTLKQMSQWLGSAGEQRPAGMLEEDLKNVVEAGWLMHGNTARGLGLEHDAAVPR